MPTYILGISAFYHDSAAVVVRDGEIVAAAQEERFSRKKHDHAFPEHAIEYCLAEAGIQAGDLDHVGFCDKPIAKFVRLLDTYLAFAPSGFRSFKKAMPLWLKQKLDIPVLIRGSLGKSFRGLIVFIEHHESHAASTFFPSPLERAAILTLDGVGEWATGTMGYGEENRITLTHELRFPHSLGLLYSAFTYYLGFKANAGEYKVMGLAPYGRPTYSVPSSTRVQALRRRSPGMVRLQQRGVRQRGSQAPLAGFVLGQGAALRAGPAGYQDGSPCRPVKDHRQRQQRGGFFIMIGEKRAGDAA